MATLTGGKKVLAELKIAADKLNRAHSVDVGFLPDAKYPDGTPVAYVAAIQEFGGTFDHPGGTRYITDAVVDKKTLRLGTRFVGPEFVGDTLVTKAHKITIPSRPFFRNMIAAKSGEWGKALGKLITDNGYDAAKALDAAGQAIAGQLRQSIVDTNSPPNASSTIARKGSAKPLVDTGFMLSRVDKAVY